MDSRPTSHPAVVRVTGRRKRPAEYYGRLPVIPLTFPEPGAIERLFREAQRKRAA